MRLPWVVGLFARLIARYGVTYNGRWDGGVSLRLVTARQEGLPTSSFHPMPRLSRTCLGLIVLPVARSLLCREARLHGLLKSTILCTTLCGNGISPGTIVRSIVRIARLRRHKRGISRGDV
jgi:hypothetical protein